MAQRRKIWRSPIIVTSLVVLALAGATVVGWRVGINRSSRPPLTSSKNSGADAQQSAEQRAPDTVVPNPAPNPNPDVPGGSTQASPSALAAPSGTFVNNHTPSLSDSSRNSENSVCVTTPGASCDITFSMGSTIKRLGSKVADDKGVASWDWTPQSIGLTVGSWQIQAIATGKGQTESTVDSLKLNVQP